MQPITPVDVQAHQRVVVPNLGGCFLQRPSILVGPDCTSPAHGGQRISAIAGLLCHIVQFCPVFYTYCLMILQRGRGDAYMAGVHDREGAHLKQQLGGCWKGGYSRREVQHMLVAARHGLICHQVHGCRFQSGLHQPGDSCLQPVKGSQCAHTLKYPNRALHRCMR